jgi:hypothetical protein
LQQLATSQSRAGPRHTQQGTPEPPCEIRNAAERMGVGGRSSRVMMICKRSCAKEKSSTTTTRTCTVGLRRILGFGFRCLGATALRTAGALDCTGWMHRRREWRGGSGGQNQPIQAGKVMRGARADGGAESARGTGTHGICRYDDFGNLKKKFRKKVVKVDDEVDFYQQELTAQAELDKRYGSERRVKRERERQATSLETSEPRVARGPSVWSRAAETNSCSAAAVVRRFH